MILALREGEFMEEFKGGLMQFDAKSEKGKSIFYVTNYALILENQQKGIYLHRLHS